MMETVVFFLSRIKGRRTTNVQQSKTPAFRGVHLLLRTNPASGVTAVSRKLN